MKDPHVLGIVLAGGAGGRLGALTDDVAKPALPVAGTFRLIDVALSNLAHSGISDVRVAVQYRPEYLIRHLAGGRPWDLDRTRGGLQILPPFEGGEMDGFASGNTDTLYRNLESIRRSGADLVVVMSADHLYQLDVRDVVTTHLESSADLTMVTTMIDTDTTRYGNVHVEDGTVVAFDYKPDDPTSSLVTTEVFCYSADALEEALTALAAEGELGDYGEDLIPWFVDNRRVVEHRHEGYWLDVGTLQSYWAGNLQILDGTGLPVDDDGWPIMTEVPSLLPAVVGPDASVTRSMLAPGSRIDGLVEGTVVGCGVSVAAGAEVRASVLLDDVEIASGAVLENVVVASGATVPGGRRGKSGHVTLLGPDGTIADQQRLDDDEALPRL